MSKIIQFKSKEELRILEETEQKEQERINLILLEEIKEVCSSIKNNGIKLYVTYDGINTFTVEPDSLFDMAKELDSIQNTYKLEADQIDERLEGNFVDSAFSYILKVHISDVTNENKPQIKKDIMDMIKNYTNSIFHVWDLNRDTEAGLAIVDVIGDIATMTTNEAEEILFDGMEEYQILANIYRDRIPVTEKVNIDDAIKSINSSIKTMIGNKNLTSIKRESNISDLNEWINTLKPYTKAETNKVYYSLFNNDSKAICIIDEEGNILKSI